MQQQGMSTKSHNQFSVFCWDGVTHGLVLGHDLAQGIGFELHPCPRAVEMGHVQVQSASGTTLKTLT